MLHADKWLLFSTGICNCWDFCFWSSLSLVSFFFPSVSALAFDSCSLSANWDSKLKEEMLSSGGVLNFLVIMKSELAVKDS